MRTAARLTIAVFFTWCAPLFFSAPARAEATVALLGVRSVDGESELERRLSLALRSAAGSIASWTIAKREASLEQMTLALGCEDADAPCLTEIAKTLGVDTLVYGSVVGSAESYDLTVFQFATDDKQVHSAATRGLKAPQLRGPNAREAIIALLYQLNGSAQAAPTPATGQLHIHGDVPGAQISIDGTTVGALDEQGSLTVQLPPGKHVVRAAGQALAPAEQKVALVEAGASAQLELRVAPPTVQRAPLAVVMPDVEQPAAHPKRSLRRAFGWATIGLGAAFAIATVYSWVRIEHINDDKDFLTYRGAFPRAGEVGGVGNVCPSAARGELAMRDESKAGLERRANDLCKEADTLQTLQYVFLGGALVSAGVGTYLLVSAKRAERASLTFAPRFGFQSASLEARLRF